MNKKILSLTSLAALLSLASCSPTTSNPTTSLDSLDPTESDTNTSISEPSGLNLETTLSYLNKGIKTGTKFTLDIDGDSTSSYSVVAMKEKEVSATVFEDETKQEKFLHETYKGLEDDNYVYYVSLEADNEFSYTKVILNGEFATWDMGYSNPFASLVASDFESVDSTTFKLKTDKLTSLSDEFSFLLYGAPGFGLEDIELIIDEQNVSLKGIGKYESMLGTYDLIAESIIIEGGESVNIDYKTPKFDEINDDTVFNKVFEDLKANNYTATILNDDGFDQWQNTVLVEEDKILYSYNGSMVGLYQYDENLVQQVIHKDDGFYKVGEPFEDNLINIYPSFDFARECFDKVNDTTYNLKNDVGGYCSDFLVFLEVYCDEFDSLTLTISEDSYAFVNTYSDDSYTSIIFTNIGSTDVGYDKDTVLEPVASALWNDILDEAGYALLVSSGNEELASILPVPTNYPEWIQFSEEEGLSFLVAEPLTSIEKDLIDYTIQLEDAGFIIYEEPFGELGGYPAICEIETELGLGIFVVEYGIVEDLFAIITYTIYE